MKKLGLGLLMCCALLQAVAQETEWLTDLSKAQAQAKRETNGADGF